MSFQKELGNYLTARLAYENGIGGTEAVHQMQRELDLMKMTHYDAGLRLLQAELYLLTDRREKAQTILKELQDSAALKISGDRKLNCLVPLSVRDADRQCRAEGHFDPPAAAVCVGGDGQQPVLLSDASASG